MAKLTETQKELFPQLLAEYLQRKGAKGIETILGTLSDSSKSSLYALCDHDYREILKKQLKQLEDADGS